MNRIQNVMTKSEANRNRRLADGPSGNEDRVGFEPWRPNLP